MFLCEGLFGECVVAVCEFNELCEGNNGVGAWFGAPRCRGYLVLIWLGIGNLFVGMYILLAILGQFVLG